MKTEFTCHTDDCLKCLHLPYCTKDEPNYEPSDTPVLCPECGSWFLGLLSDGKASACLICGEIIEHSKIIKNLYINEVLR